MWKMEKGHGVALVLSQHLFYPQNRKPNFSSLMKKRIEDLQKRGFEATQVKAAFSGFAPGADQVVVPFLGTLGLGKMQIKQHRYLDAMCEAKDLGSLERFFSRMRNLRQLDWYTLLTTDAGDTILQTKKYPVRENRANRALGVISAEVIRHKSGICVVGGYSGFWAEMLFGLTKDNHKQNNKGYSPNMPMLDGDIAALTFDGSGQLVSTELFSV